MSATLLEVTRSLHEDLERFQQAIIEEIEYPPRNIKENIFQVHRVNTYLDKAQETADRLGNIYEDRDGARRDEIASMAGVGPQLFSMFYDKLKEVKDYHRRFPDASIDYPEDHIFIVDDEETARLFSGDEYYGKALDLHFFYDRYINLKHGQKTDYMTYLSTFYKFNDDLLRKDDKEYVQYLKELSEYLSNYLPKAQPLEENAKILKEIEEEFERKWALGEFTGWDAIYPPVKQEPLVKEEKKEEDRHRRDREERRDDRRHRDERDDRKRDRNDRKKKEVPLEENPLYCRACGKLFAKDTVFNGHLVGKKHLAAVKKIESVATASAPENRVQFKDVYAQEWKIHQLCVLHYQEQITNSKINIEKKQSKTARELELEFEEEEPADQDIDEIIQEPEIKLTKDNYPVGWDGKPIPYWLYKLHGLGVEYKCEICGNASYWGRKAYEKHFQEWRHAHGMRCLGIPNTRHFLDITKINDAMALWQKLRRDGTKVELEEEYEDQEGNVYNKKTYEDLKRQGLIK